MTYAPSEELSAAEAPDCPDAPQDSSPAQQRAERRSWLVVAFLTLAGTLLRIATINTRSFWLDEAITVEQTRLPDAGAVIMGQVGNVHPPLFHVLQHYWSQVFGFSEVAMRGFSTTIGIITIPLAYIAGRVLCGRRAGLITAGIVALAPYYVWYSQEARMYALSGMWAFASMAALGYALRDNRRWQWALYGVVTLLGLYTHFFYIFLLAGQCLAVLAVAWRTERRARQEGRAVWSRSRPLGIFTDVPVLAGAMISTAAAVAGFGVWVWRSVFGESNALVSSATGSGLGYGQSAPSLAWRLNDAGRMLIEMTLGFHADPAMFSLVAMWPLVISLMLVMLDLVRPLGRNALVPVVSASGLLVIVALGQWQGQVLASRYSIAAAAPVVLTIGVIVAMMPRRTARVLMTVAVLLAAGLYLDQSYNPDNAMRHDNRQAIQHLVDNAQVGDILIYEPFYTAPVFDYYLPTTIPSYDFPQHGRFGFVRRGKPDLAEDLDRVIGPTNRVWLMLSYQDIETVRGDAYNTINWFKRNGFRLKEDKQLARVQLMLWEVEVPREGWDFQERRVR